MEPRSPWLVRVRLGGDSLLGFDVPDLAASVRLLLPRPGRDHIELPRWNGNEFLHEDGQRPAIRTLTPLDPDPAAGTLDVEIVVHDGGPMSDWVQRARPGQPAAISGPGRGYEIDGGAASLVLAGDESALPAIGQILAAAPADLPVTALVEVAHPDARIDLPAGPRSTVEWLDRDPGQRPGDVMVEAVTTRPVSDGAKLWVAGEAAAVQRIRKHLFEGLGLSRSDAVVRGYWKLTTPEA